MAARSDLPSSSVQPWVGDFARDRAANLRRKHLPNVGPQERGWRWEWVEPVKGLDFETDPIFADSKQGVWPGSTRS